MTVLYLFDIDGTLLHAHGSGRGAFDAVFAERHGVVNASEGIRYGGKTDPAIVDEIFAARLGRAPMPRSIGRVSGWGSTSSSRSRSRTPRIAR